MSNETLYAFRVIVKTTPHPTQSLTLRVFDMLAASAEEALQLSNRRDGKHAVLVQPIAGDLSQIQYQHMHARLLRRRARQGA